MRKWSEKVVIRCMSDGKFLRMHPAGFWARLPSGPYETVDQAAKAPMNMWDADAALGFTQRLHP